MSTSFVQRLFLIAGIYGIVVVAPLFFAEPFINAHDPPAITHAEFYYGFIAAALAWQFVYLLVARDPLRYRPVIIPGIFSKAGFAIAAYVLTLQGRLPPKNLFLPTIDLALAILFAWAFVSLRDQSATRRS